MAPEESAKPVSSSHFGFVVEHVWTVELFREVVCEAPYIFRRQAIKAPLRVGDVFAEGYFNLGPRRSDPTVATFFSHCLRSVRAGIPKCRLTAFIDWFWSADSASFKASST